MILLLLIACGTETAPRSSPENAIPTAHLEAEFEFKEYPGSQWYGPDGNPIPDRSGVINAITGPDHCEWESAVMLHLGWPLGHDAADASELRQYLRDPEGVFTGQMLMAAFDEEVLLTKNAEYTGYRTDFMELWLDSDTDEAAFLVFADHVERWPRASEVIACG